MRLLLLPLIAVPLFSHNAEQACRALSSLQIADVEITAASHASATANLPAYCVVRGKIDKRIGVGGTPFAIGFELRLPDEWQGRFLFQGGGGMDGLVRPATGQVSGGLPALARGFAVASTDGGHEGQPPDPTADSSFACDQQARIDNAYRP